MRREGGSEEGVSEGGREGERERREGGRGKEKRGWVAIFTDYLLISSYRK